MINHEGHDPNTGINLSLADTAALIEELMGRFDHAIFSGLVLRQQQPTGEQRGDQPIYFKGSYVVCAGLCSQMSLRINLQEAQAMQQSEQQQREPWTKPDPDEDANQ